MVNDTLTKYHSNWIFPQGQSEQTSHNSLKDTEGCGTGSDTRDEKMLPFHLIRVLLEA